LSAKFISSRIISFYSPAISFGDAIVPEDPPSSSKLYASFGIRSYKAKNISLHYSVLKSISAFG